MEPKPAPYPASVPTPSNTEQQDTEHLQLLSVFYYILAGLSAFGGFFPLLYVLFGVVMLGGAAAAGNEHADERTGLAVVGGIIMVVGFGAAVLVWAFAWCLYLVGNYLREARNRTFCFVIAGILCLNVPLGAALGIFTFIVLSRDSVRARFAGGASNPFAPPGADFKRYS